VPETWRCRHGNLVGGERAPTRPHSPQQDTASRPSYSEAQPEAGQGVLLSKTDTASTSVRGDCL
jgi:hypothetical protein